MTVFCAGDHHELSSAGDVEMGPPLLDAPSKGPGFQGGLPLKSQDHRRDDLFAPSEAGYTTDGTDFDFSDTEGSDIDLDSPTSVETAVEESAASIGEHVCNPISAHLLSSASVP